MKERSMNRKIFGAALVILAFLLMSPMASASVVCANGQNVVLLNDGGGCTAFGLLFNNFSVINASAGVGSAEIDIVSVTNNGGDILLDFNPNLGNGTSGGTISDLHFSFSVTGGVQAVSLQNGGINGTSVAETVCAGTPEQNPNYVNGGCATNSSVPLWTQVAGDNSPNYTSSIFEGQNVVVFKDISISNTGVGGSHLTSFTQDFLVPEPMSLITLGSGLVALGLLRFRKSKKG